LAGEFKRGLALEGMRMEKPKKALQVPTWFNIKNYDKCDNFSKKEWADQLDYRLALFEEINENLDGYVLSCYGYSLESILNNIHEFGIINLEPFNPLFSSRSLSKRAKGFRRIESSAIKPISTSTMSIMGSHVKTVFKNNTSLKSNESIDDFLELFNQSPFDEFRRIHEQEQEESTLETAFLSIDLSIPNSEILKQMKTFLPAYRKALGIDVSTKLASSENINDLIEGKILAVLDLNIWEILNHVSIKPSVFITALYPGGLQGETELKKYKRNAKKLLTEHFILLLKE
jgi:hypothetical protein